jgi:hypothetical protein
MAGGQTDIDLYISVLHHSTTSNLLKLTSEYTTFRQSHNP